MGKNLFIILTLLLYLACSTPSNASVISGGHIVIDGPDPFSENSHHVIAASVLNWSSFQVTSTDTTGQEMHSIEWLSQRDRSITHPGAYIVRFPDGPGPPLPPPPTQMNDWTSGTYREEGNDHIAFTNSDTTNALYATNFNFFSGRPYHLGSTAIRSGVFQVTGSGLLTFSVDFEWLLDAEIADWTSISTNAVITVGKSLSDGTNLSLDDSSGKFTSNASGSGYWEDEGTLSISMLFSDGETGFLNTEVNAHLYLEEVGTGSPVPIPCAVWLLGSGFAGLVVIRRIK